MLYNGFLRHSSPNLKTIKTRMLFWKTSEKEMRVGSVYYSGTQKVQQQDGSHTD